MMSARDIDYLSLEDDDKSDFDTASADGRLFAISGGVANAVVHALKDRVPDREVKVMNAEGLNECRAMLKDAAKGLYDGYLLEGMACPGGCVAGAGTLQPISKSTAAVKRYATRSPYEHVVDNSYRSLIRFLELDEEGSFPEETAAAIEEAEAAKKDV